MFDKETLIEGGALTAAANAAVFDGELWETRPGGFAGR